MPSIKPTYTPWRKCVFSEWSGFLYQCFSSILYESYMHTMAETCAPWVILSCITVSAQFCRRALCTPWQRFVLSEWSCNVSLFQLHFVHYNAKYESFKNACREPDGLLVVAVFVKVSYQWPSCLHLFMHAMTLKCFEWPWSLECYVMRVNIQIEMWIEMKTWPLHKIL